MVVVGYGREGGWNLVWGCGIGWRGLLATPPQPSDARPPPPNHSPGHGQALPRLGRRALGHGQYVDQGGVVEQVALGLGQAGQQVGLELCDAAAVRLLLSHQGDAPLLQLPSLLQGSGVG